MGLLFIYINLSLQSDSFKYKSFRFLKRLIDFSKNNKENSQYETESTWIVEEKSPFPC